jgi:hypothetical protein
MKKDKELDAAFILLLSDSNTSGEDGEIVTVPISRSSHFAPC